ncbi:hypothetical protein V8C26DRAFT_397068 [Trichoderma gracile]
MNQIRAIQALNKKEIENGISPDASWHVDYRDTAFVYFGGLPYDLSEGDIITIFSQYGEPVFLKLVRDKETGKSKGFGWLKYEDQRSTDLAVDNLGGTEIGGRLLRVDHARYQARDDEDQEQFKVGWEDIQRREGKAVSEDEEGESDKEAVQRPLLPEERELALLMRDHDDDDPMKDFLIEEKKKEVEEARRRADRKEKSDSHRHHRHHRSRRDKDDDRHERSRREERSREREKRTEGESRRHRHRDDSRDRHRRHRDRSREDSQDRERRREKRSERDDRPHRRDDERERHRRRREDEDDVDDDRRRRSHRKSRSRSPRRQD